MNENKPTQSRPVNLHRLEQLKAIIEALESKREALAALSCAVPAIDYGKDIVDTSPQPDPPFVKMQAAIQAIDAQIAQANYDYIIDGAKMIEGISTIDADDVGKAIMYDRYIKLKPLHQIANDLVLSYSHVCRLHNACCRAYNRARKTDKKQK